MIHLIVGLLLATPLASAQEANFFSVIENRKGIEALKKENPIEAQKHFLQSLADNPMDARLQLNLGFSLEKMGLLDKARSAYDISAKSGQDPEVLFAANYNRGVLFQKEKKKEDALAAYQEALKYNPDSLETKTNIELLTKDDDQGKDDKQDQSKDGDQGSDKKDQKQGDQKEQKDQDKEQQKDGKDQKDQPKQYGKNKPQPKPFKSDELTQGDVNKILGEIKQQEQKIRAEFNKKDVKDRDLDKDW